MRYPQVRWVRKTHKENNNNNNNNNSNSNNNNNNNNNSNKKRTCRNADFAAHRVKLKKSEKKDEYLDLARELTKLWNMKVMVLPIVIGALGTITKGLLKGIENLEIR